MKNVNFFTWPKLLHYISDGGGCRCLSHCNNCIISLKLQLANGKFPCRMEEQLVPCECALKVFKTTLVEFKTREKYIKADYRFKDRFRKQNPRKVIHMWAEKEMHNLNR